MLIENYKTNYCHQMTEKINWQYVEYDMYKHRNGSGQFKKHYLKYDIVPN